VLRVIATDPGAAKDFEHFCKTTGHHLLSAREEAGTLVFEIRKAG
jgi:tRNA 2-thiouridine synthesizing protein A